MTILQNQFSPHVNRVLVWTQAEAKRLDHDRIEPEHLLIGLIQDKSSAAYRILESLQVDFISLEDELRKSLQEIPQSGVSNLEMSDATKQVLELSLESVGVLQRPYLGTEHMLIGLLRAITNRAYPILRRAGVSYNQVLAQIENLPPESADWGDLQIRPQAPPAVEPGEKLSLFQILTNISLTFWGLVAATILLGVAAYQNRLESGIAVFSFVTLGWVVSLSLHEFGHAIIAYYGGDYTVKHKGYLSLNPLRYTHGFLSIVLPLFYLALGGIGLPGGAVYINHGNIPSRRVRSLVAAGGPLMTGLFSIFLAVPFVFGLAHETLFQHREFWAAWSVLTFIQITSLLFNLLPIPGLDGFGILLPFLPQGLVRRIGSFGSLTLVLIFLLFFQDTSVSRGFWVLVRSLVDLVNIDFELIISGLDLYQFWR